MAYEDGMVRKESAAAKDVVRMAMGHYDILHGKLGCGAYGSPQTGAVLQTAAWIDHSYRVVADNKGKICNPILIRGRGLGARTLPNKNTRRHQYDLCRKLSG